MMQCNVKVRGGSRMHREIAEKVIHWCYETGVVETNELHVNVKICKYTTHQCWGSVERAGFNRFDMTVATNQSLRDFIATITHEMVHVNQYVTGDWEGDGEAEAESREYELADGFWKGGHL